MRVTQRDYIPRADNPKNRRKALPAVVPPKVAVPDDGGEQPEPMPIPIEPEPIPGGGVGVGVGDGAGVGSGVGVAAAQNRL
ncbi:MAG: hypothetical protein L0Z73_09560 [Gammaproteobacteria bacterium]|nr:hypothetical protein [Gammaproteobacteria bacterium]